MTTRETYYHRKLYHILLSETTLGGKKPIVQVGIKGVVFEK